MGKKENTFPSQWELKVETTKPPKARENAGDQVGFSFASDWLREWRGFFGTNHRVKKSKINAVSDYFRH